MACHHANFIIWSSSICFASREAQWTLAVCLLAENRCSQGNDDAWHGRMSRETLAAFLKLMVMSGDTHFLQHLCSPFLLPLHYLLFHLPILFLNDVNNHLWTSPHISEHCVESPLPVYYSSLHSFLNLLLSGDTLFHLTSLTPPTSTPTFPSRPSLTSLHTADFLDKLSQYNSNTSMLPAHSDFITWWLTLFFLSLIIFHIPSTVDISPSQLHCLWWHSRVNHPIPIFPISCHF